MALHGDDGNDGDDRRHTYAYASLRYYLLGFLEQHYLLLRVEPIFLSVTRLRYLGVPVALFL